MGAPHFCMDRLLERTPAGARLAYIVGDTAYILGKPDVDPSGESPHNCDAMGCASEHVIQRIKLAAATAAPRADAAMVDLGRRAAAVAFGYTSPNGPGGDIMGAWWTNNIGLDAVDALASPDAPPPDLRPGEPEADRWEPAKWEDFRDTVRELAAAEGS